MITIKKFKSRRYYNTFTSKFINFDNIIDIVKTDGAFIIDEADNDITEEVLKSLIPNLSVPTQDVIAFIKKYPKKKGA